MKRNAASISRKPSSRRSTRNSIDTATQTEQLIIEEDITRLPVVLLDKSVITRYIQRHGNHDIRDEENDVNDENIGRLITTTNYSTFLKRMTNNTYANSTIQRKRRTSFSPAIRNKSRRRVKFLKPKNLRSTRRKSSDEEVHDLSSMPPARDISYESMPLEPISEHTEIGVLDDNVLELDEEAIENQEVESIELGSLNGCEISLNAEIQDLIPNIEEIQEHHPVHAVTNTGSTMNGTGTKSTEIDESDFKFDCIRINANTVNIYNHFHARKC